MHAHLTDDGIEQVVADIWTSILGLDVTPGSAPEANGDPSVTGVIHITGESDGTVSLECPSVLARRATALMFGMDEADLTSAEVEDALGELTNMTGGGIKALLPGPCQLSLPTVVEGTSYHINLPGAVAVRDVWFDCDGSQIAVRVFERAAAR